ncbi:MAG: DUF4388 domain-containing protein, partial [Myxococcota bacterium]
MGRRHRTRTPSGKLDGNLCQLAVTRIVELCQEERVTGTLRINSWGRAGSIYFHGGEAVDSVFGSSKGRAAMTELHTLRDGIFQFEPRLPKLEGGAVNGDEVRGDLALTSLSAIMAQCRDQAISCTISFEFEGAPVELSYQTGELVSVQGSGASALNQLTGINSGEVIIRAQSLDLEERRTSGRVTAQWSAQMALAPSPAAAAQMADVPAPRRTARGSAPPPRRTKIRAVPPPPPPP